jgi:poly(A) polymerase
VLEGRGGSDKRDSGKAKTGPLMEVAMKNTDQRIAVEKPVTPAFLLAALLWHPVRKRAEVLQAEGLQEYVALGEAADEVMSKQVQRTAIPRRFSVVTRQIWTMQPRFNHTHGRRAKSLMNERRFRAAYDFLLLRAEEDESLKVLCDHWTEAQKGVQLNTGQNDRFTKTSRRRPRRRTRRRGAPPAKT